MRGYQARPERAPSAQARQRSDASSIQAAMPKREAAARADPTTKSLLQLRAALDESPGVKSQLALQRRMNGGNAGSAQSGATAGPKKATPIQKKPNATGLPDRLKDGVEQLSGLALDDVRVHYNSHKPATVQAHAYAQGTDIHVAPGQEQHLPHEAWHVVQQKQGRVKPTLQLKGVAINDDAGLEREADVMAGHALKTAVAPLSMLSYRREPSLGHTAQMRSEVIQLGGSFSKPAVTKTFPKATNVFRADRRPPEVLRAAGGMKIRLPPNANIPKARATLYMLFSASNPGVLSAAKTFDGAFNFAQGLSNSEEIGPQPTIYIYKMNVSEKKAIDVENTVPRFVQWLFGSESEEMLIENVPFTDLNLVTQIGPSEPVAKIDPKKDENRS